MNETNLTFTWTDYASTNLNLRIQKLKANSRRVPLDRRVESIQFLRGIASRAGQLLPALYNALGARSTIRTKIARWQAVQAANIEFSSLQTISMISRSAFDESKKGMTGKRFATISDETLNSIADYWAGLSNQPVRDAANALALLRSVFQRCAMQPDTLLDAESLLERRIGLLKHHANREAAHLSLEFYVFDILDLIHVVAATTMIGAMIYDFDSGSRETGYFDSIDEAGWRSGTAIFPALRIPRIFQGFDIHQQASLCWRNDSADGLDILLNRLPQAIGYWDSEKASAEL